MRVKLWQDFSVGDQQEALSITITETHIVTWAGLTTDFYPLHMDEEYARNTIFKGRVAHGPMIFAMAIGLVGSSGFLGSSVIAWLGVENMRLTTPVRAGDTIGVVATVIEKRETQNQERGIVVFEYEVRNQRGEKVMKYHNLILFPRCS